MIYLVTNNKPLFESPLYKVITPQESLDLMHDWKEIQYDCETSGLNCHINHLICMQFGNGVDQIVVDNESVCPIIYKDLLESALLIGHNLKFDLQFLYNYKIVPTHVYDTMIAEQTMYMGFPYSKIWKSEYDKYHYDFPIIFEGGLGQLSFSLKALCHKYLGLEMDKSVRDTISSRGLDDSVIIYSAHDVEYLQQIKEKQSYEAHKKDLAKAIALECKFVPVIAYMEWCGVHLDATKWSAKMEKDNANLKAAEEALNKFVIETPDLKEFTYINLQGDLFTGFDSEPKVSINWSSSKQVVKVCKILGFNTTTTDKKTGIDKDTVLEKELSVQKGINDKFLELYFKYQEYAKVVSSFGQTWLNSINPVTARLHTKYNQLGASSGRLSCGGGNDDDLAIFKKLPKGSCKLLNCQQLPHDPETRACFTAENGNQWCSCDFSAEEARLTADVSGDREYYKEFTERTGDTHAMFAWACYEKECRALGCESAAEVKTKAKVWRNKVKPAEFKCGLL